MHWSISLLTMACAGKNVRVYMLKLIWSSQKLETEPTVLSTWGSSETVIHPCDKKQSNNLV